MSIDNKQFWDLWRQERYEDALTCSLEEDKSSKQDRLQSMLFGSPDQLKQTSAILTISVGEFIYDYVMINPTVVEGLDFARTEDLSSLFTLSQLSSEIDTTELAGEMAQLQGYVAEQMLAMELQAKGHDVEFPQESNNPGWDMLVDGQPFQVKNLADPGGVKDHLETYPDVPVYVNEDLASHFEGNPNVYVSNLSHEDVIEATRTTLSHSDELLDFETPWIAAGVSSFYNIKKVWSDDVAINYAVFNVVSDTSSRVVLGALGQKAGVAVGTMLFGPAGGITGAMFGAFAGTSQGGRVSTGVKRAFSKKLERELILSMEYLIQKVVGQLNKKYEVKQQKIQRLREELSRSKANQAVWQDIERRHKAEINYLLNKKEELNGINESLQNHSVFALDILPHTMAVLTKSGVHPCHYQEELEKVQEVSNAYVEKVY